eukprot:992945-Amphidinium_carterae.1
MSSIRIHFGSKPPGLEPMGSLFWSKPGGESHVLLARLVQYIITEVPTARDSPVGLACTPPENEEKTSLMSARTEWQIVVRKKTYRKTGPYPLQMGIAFHSCAPTGLRRWTESRTSTMRSG